MKRKFLYDLKWWWATRTSDSYIRSLRRMGLKIGENCVFQDPRKVRIDVSRPALITIGDNCDMNYYFQILTHDWSSLVFRAKFHDFINSSGGGKYWK